MRSFQIALIFILSCLFFIYPLFDEPYPALILPGFVGGITDDFDTIYHSRREITIVFNQDSTVIDEELILPFVPDNMRDFAVNSIIKEYRNETDTLRDLHLLGYDILVKKKANKEKWKEDFEKKVSKEIIKRLGKTPKSLSIKEYAYTFSISEQKYSEEKLNFDLNISL